MKKSSGGVQWFLLNSNGFILNNNFKSTTEIRELVSNKKQSITFSLSIEED